MPESRDPHDDSQFDRNEPKLSHSPDGDADMEETSSSGGLFQTLRNSPWVQNNPILAKGLLTIVFASLLLAILGWQQGWFRPEPTVEEVAGPPTGATPDSDPVQTATAVPTPQPQVNVEPKPAEKTDPKPETSLPVALPAEVALWGPDDYLRARRERSPKLAEALGYLNETYRGSSETARRMASLLHCPLESGSTVPPVPATSLPGQPPLEIPQLIEVIVDALGTNGSEAAKTILGEIISGRFETDDDRAAVPAAIKAMLVNPSPETDALLLKLLVAPETVRTAEHAEPWPWKDLRIKALELVKQNPTLELRTTLAGLMVSRLMRLSPSDPLGELILASNPMNCGAQIVLCNNENISEELRAKLEQQLIDYSSSVLADLLMIPNDPQSGGDFRRYLPSGNQGMVGLSPSDPSGGLSLEKELLAETPPNPAVKVANLLWATQSCKALEDHLQKSLSLEKRPALTLLAATIPQESMRYALNGFLRRRWTDGSKALEAAGLPSRIFSDPGFLIIAKTLPRKPSKNSNVRPAVPTGSKTDAIPLAQRKELAEQDWLALSGKLVGQWRTRLNAAAVAQKKRDEDLGELPRTPILPSDFTLNPNAKVIASYHYSWPLMADPKLEPQPGFLEIHYLYAEETNKPRKAAAYYARQTHTKVADARSLDNYFWIDSLGIAQEDHRRSIDVLISSPRNAPAEMARDENEANLFIEVISIEINNPASRD